MFSLKYFDDLILMCAFRLNNFMIFFCLRWVHYVWWSFWRPGTLATVDADLRGFLANAEMFELFFQQWMYTSEI